MPATTRSQSKPKQTDLEDFQDKTAKQAEANISKSRRPANPKTKDAKSIPKRKQPDDEEKPQKSPGPPKKQKQASVNTDEDQPRAEDSTPVIINRAPVLQLWAACIAQKLHPRLPWDTHLSIGSAISALCAVSKGRAIGKIDQPTDEPDKKAEKGREKRAAKKSADDEVNVMGSKLLLKDGNAIVSGKPHKANEALLMKKYGEEDYERVKKTMEQSIDMFEGKAEMGELNRTAFHMYEDFRPSVQHGQGGWGKKGELRLGKIRELAERR